jgi:TPR repeat protein
MLRSRLVIPGLFSLLLAQAGAGATPDPKDLEKSCNQGIAKSCYQFGKTLLEKGGGKKGLQLIETACTDKVGEACDTLGGYSLMTTYFNADDPKQEVWIPRNTKKSAQYYAKACLLGYARGCYHSADSFLTGTGVGLSESTYFELMDRACTLGDAGSCITLGRAFLTGNWDSDLSLKLKDKARAMRYFSQACQAGSQPGCAFLRKDGPPVWPPELTQCTGKDILKNSCYDIAQKLIRELNKEMFQKGFSMLEEGCSQGGIFSCSALADLYRDGWPDARDLVAGESPTLVKDPAKAVEFLAKACDGKESSQCLALATMYKEGSGVGASAAKYLEYSEKACSMGEAKSCEALGDLYNSGEWASSIPAVPKDADKANQYYTKACDQDHGSTACKQLRREGPVEQPKELATFEHSCNAGSAKACEVLGSRLTGELNKELFAKGLQLLDRECTKAAVGCRRLGKLYQYGWPFSVVPASADSLILKPDPAKATKLYSKACESGDSFGCLDAAHLFIPKDFHLASRFLQKACQTEHFADCSLLTAGPKRDSSQHRVLGSE